MTITVTRGFTFQGGVPYTIADLNAAALPNITFVGSFGTSDIADGAVTAAKSSPGPYWYGTASGGPAAYVASLNPAPASLVAGLFVRLAFATTNTGPVTLNLNGLGVKDVTKRNGQPLAAADIIAGTVHGLSYDGTRWLLQGESGSPRRFWPTSTGTGTAYAITLADYPIAAVADLVGLPFAWKAHASSTGAATLAVNGLPPVSLTRHDGTPIQAGDIALDAPMVVLFDGSNFRALNVLNIAVPPSAAIEYVTTEANGTATALASATVVASGAATLPAGKTWKHVRVTFTTFLDDDAGLETFVLENSSAVVTAPNTARGSYITNNSDDSTQITVSWEWIPSGGAESANLVIDVKASKPGGATNGDQPGNRKLVICAVAQ
jgi:hypothetical protein